MEMLLWRECRKQMHRKYTAKPFVLIWTTNKPNKIVRMFSFGLCAKKGPSNNEKALSICVEVVPFFLCLSHPLIIHLTLSFYPFIFVTNLLTLEAKALIINNNLKHGQKAHTKNIQPNKRIIIK